MQTGCDGPQLCLPWSQTYFPPGCALVVGHKCHFITNRVNDRFSVLAESGGDINQLLCARRWNPLYPGRGFFPDEMRAGNKKCSSSLRRAWIHPQFAGRLRQARLLGPALASISRNKKCGGSFFSVAGGHVENLGI